MSLSHCSKILKGFPKTTLIYQLWYFLQIMCEFWSSLLKIDEKHTGQISNRY
jgi:hypothetical protein